MAPKDANPELFPSVCPHDCPSTCALEVERLNGQKIGRVYGSKRNTYNDGVICEKVARYSERVHHPDRLSVPLRRTNKDKTADPDFAPIGWDEAISEIADRFTAVSEEYGPEAIWPYYYAGTMGIISRTAVNRLSRAMGYSLMLETICVGFSHPGFKAGTGRVQGTDAREMEHSEVIVMWGGNPVHTQVHVMNWVARAKKRNNAKFVVIDPYRTATAEKADLHLMLKPGTDGALACAVMNILFQEGYADWDYLREYTDCPERLQQHVSSRDARWASAITGLSEAEIIEFARLYGSTKRSFVRLGYGFTRSRNGAANMHAASCLPAITGAWTEKGGGALYGQSEIYGIDRTLIDGLDMKKPDPRALDMCRLAHVLDGDRQDLGDGPPVRAMFVQHCNPAAVSPDSARVYKGFQQDDFFLVVHEQFMTDTAKLADIVLPATTFLEQDDFFISSGHTYLQVTKPVIEPYGQSKSNHDTLCLLAKALGASHPGFEMSGWEMVDETLKRSDYPPAQEIFDKGGYDCANSFEEQHFLNGFGHKDGKFRFSPDWAGLGRHGEAMPGLPDHWDVIDNATAEKPFRLVTAPSRSFLNTSFNETPTSRKKNDRPTALLHPDDCARLGVKEGDQVTIGNERGEIIVHVKPFDGLKPGVSVVEGVWANSAFKTGKGVNFVTSDDYGAPWGGAAFHDTAVWIRALENS